MRSTPFQPLDRLVFVWGVLVGPVRTVRVYLALDTGANQTLLKPDILQDAGYELPPTAPTHRIRTAGGTIRTHEVWVSEFACLGHSEQNFRVLAHAVPRLGLDGLLGLDFLRDRYPSLDFRRGRIRFGVPSWWRFWL